MKKYAKEILIALVCFVLVLALNFALPRMLPGDPVAYLTGLDEESMTGVSYEQYRAALHLDESISSQFVHYLRSLIDGTLGFSYKKNSDVATVIGSCIGKTLQISIPAAVISSLVGLLWGMKSGYRKNSVAEKISTSFQMFINSAPTFLIALLLIIICCFENRWLPYTGLNSIYAESGIDFILDRIMHLILPVLSLVIAQTPSRYLLIRNTVSYEMSQKYVLYAKERGLSPRCIQYRYIFKNIAAPFLSMFGISIGASIGGSLVVENIFSINGMGRLLSEAAGSLDYPLMQGILFVSTAIMVIAVVFTDIICIFIDPRVKAGGRNENK